MILIWTISQPFYTVVLTSKSVWNTNSVQYWLLWTTQQQQGRLLPYLLFILVWFLEFFCHCHFNTSRWWKQFEAKWLGKNHFLLILYLKCCLISFCNQLVLQLSPSGGKSLSPPPPPPPHCESVSYFKCKLMMSQATLTMSNDAPIQKWDTPLHRALRALLFTKSVWVL